MWQLGYFGLAKETDYSVGVTPTVFLPAVSITAQEAAMPQPVAPWGTAGVTIPKFGFDGSFNAEVEVQPNAFGHLMTAVMGQPETLTLGGGAFRHTWTPRPNRPTYTVEMADEVIALRALGGACNALAVDIAPSTRFRAAMAFAARTVEPRARSTTSYHTQEALTWDGVTVQISGATENALTRLSIGLLSYTRPYAAWGNTGRTGSVRFGAQTGLMLTMEMQEISSAWLGRFRDQKEISITATGVGPLLGTSSYQLILDCPRLRLVAATPAVAVRNLPRMIIQGNAVASPGAPRGFSVILVNATASY